MGPRAPGAKAVGAATGIKEQAKAGRQCRADAHKGSGSLIVCSNVPRLVGSVYTPDLHAMNGVYVEPQPHYCVRAATKQEYFAECPAERYALLDWDNMYFYEVTTD